MSVERNDICQDILIETARFELEFTVLLKGCHSWVLNTDIELIMLESLLIVGVVGND